MLTHEKLEVYQKSLDFLPLVTVIIDALPKGHAPVGDQLKRAAMSIPLKIAEASGRTGSADNARHFSVAPGSALECEAVFDVGERLAIIHSERFCRRKTLLKIR